MPKPATSASGAEVMALPLRTEVVGRAPERVDAPLVAAATIAAVETAEGVKTAALPRQQNTRASETHV